MTQQVRRIPDGYHPVTPYVIVKGAARFVGFMEKAFGATDRGQVFNDDGTIVWIQSHVEDVPEDEIMNRMGDEAFGADLTVCAKTLDREIRRIGRRP